MELKVDLGHYSYDVVIQKGILHHIESRISSCFNGKRIMIISDDHVFPIYGNIVKQQLLKQYEVYEIVVEHGEASKQFDKLEGLYEQLTDARISRSDLIIALGGGVIGDLAGFVASTYLRGIDFINIPTSLLAQVDSSVGGKVAVDLRQGKNLVGAFKHPLLVIIDPLTLDTLDHDFICDGMGEVIKYGCIMDVAFFEQLESYQGYDELMLHIDEIIYRCICLKRDVVLKDVYDFGCRLSLNFGHTLAHALEQYYDYKRYTHGRAVAIGCAQMARLGELLHLTKEGTYERICLLLEKFELLSYDGLDVNLLKQAIMLDKKNLNASLSYVLISEIGHYFIYKGDIDLIDCLKEI